MECYIYLIRDVIGKQMTKVRVLVVDIGLIGIVLACSELHPGYFRTGVHFMSHK
jgi:hypothetical protein